MDISLFNRQVQEVHDVANIVVKKKNSSAIWAALTKQDLGQGRTEISFNEPTLIFNAPARGSSTAVSNRRALLMDGSFVFKNGALDHARASLEVYDYVHKNGVHTVKLIDAMHFDIESGEPQTAFHPMFHIQTGRNKRWDDERIRKQLSVLARTEIDKVSLTRDFASGVRDVRIPTPQMDYLSVCVMVIADFFCDSGATHEVKTAFKKLLTSVMGSQNPARTGRQSVELANRWSREGRAPFCASHWYVESC